MEAAMGQPPAYIFVVRHGTRLDVVDKKWHLSSPTPYDPPLTYGGWLQSRALGARIGAILRERVQEDSRRDDREFGSATRRKRRKYRVVIHSSPFLRCIQTSIGISAGLSQEPLYPTIPARTGSAPPSTSTNPTEVVPSGRPALESLQTAFEEQDTIAPTRDIHKVVLRLDAFLGEWLSPSYFELITPPPGSVMMLASAKAELLRREDYTSYPGFTAHVHSSSQGQLPDRFPGLSTPLSAPARSPPPNGLETAGSLPRSLPTEALVTELPRASSTELPASGGGYVAPLPSYALSSNAGIPMGYVSHARDACVGVDYQWDSMRAPLEWGDGGTYGEEWTTMHRRFRSGVQHLVDWYTTSARPTEMVTKSFARGKLGKGNTTGAADTTTEPYDEEEDEAEAVVILVSHGAGCNALIGAITHQPVLTDVGMASLTMAIRKADRDEFTAASPRAPASSGNTAEDKGLVPIHEYYDLKLFADTEHLRSTPAVSRSPSVAQALQARGRPANSISSALHTGYYDPAGSRSSSANAVLTSARRGSNSTRSPHGLRFSSSPNGGGITVGSGATSFSRNSDRNVSGPTRTPSTGLWTPILRNEEQSIETDEEEDDMLLNFSHERRTQSDATLPSPALGATEADSASVTAAPLAQTMSAPINIPSATNNGTTKTTNAAADPLAVVPPPSLLEDQEPERFISRLGVGPGGLWGAVPRSPPAAQPSPAVERIRELAGVKRRWTVNERA